MSAIFTIGHSRHPIEIFVDLLRQHALATLIDVRSTPFSRFNPQFNREKLARSLRDAGIGYVFLGDELGARTDDESCYVDDRVEYERLSRTLRFRKGLASVLDLSASRRVAIMCAEKEPLECHRTILVARHLVAAGREVQHIHPDGHLESHDAAVERLLRILELDHDLLCSREELIEDAYRRQGARIAYTRS